MRIDLPPVLKAIPGLNTTSEEHLKRSGKCVLVNGCSAVEPIVDINIEPRSNVESNRRVAKFPYRIHLLRQIWSFVHPTNDLPWIYPSPGSQSQLRKRLSSNSRKQLFVVVLIAPAAFYERAKLGKQTHHAFPYP